MPPSLTGPPRRPPCATFTEPWARHVRGKLPISPMLSCRATRRAFSPVAGLLLALVTAACADPPVEWSDPTTGMAFVLVPAGTFTMGTPETEPGHQADEVLHRVRISRPFYLGKYEVTQGEWQRATGGNPSHFQSCGSRCPVERVSWYEVQGFLARLGRLSGERYRLPTEAEWEYACRAGTTTAFSTGSGLGSTRADYDARYPLPGHPRGAYRERPTPVGTFPPNPWGLFDLHGNVWEWTADEHCPYEQPAAGGEVVDPVDRCGAPLKVIRGGSWYFDEASARCGLRYTHRPQDRGFSLGFRVVRELPAG